MELHTTLLKILFPKIHDTGTKVCKECGGEFPDFEAGHRIAEEEYRKARKNYK